MLCVCRSPGTLGKKNENLSQEGVHRNHCASQTKCAVSVSGILFGVFFKQYAIHTALTGGTEYLI